jgi:hypothetical protein
MALNYSLNEPLSIGVSLLHMISNKKRNYPLVVVAKYKYQQTYA